MQKRSAFIPTGIFFLLLALLFVFLFANSHNRFLTGPLEFLIVPIQRSFAGAFGAIKRPSDSALLEENRVLRGQLAKQEEVMRENNALHAQFEVTTPSSRNLLPARVVGLRGFVPGVSLPEEYVIDKGTTDGIKEGMTVLYKDNFVGTVIRASSHLAKVRLVTNTDSSLTGTALKTNALGVVRGAGNGVILFTNVVLSDTLEINDMVVTKGETELNGTGILPDVIVGKIISIEKKPSALFQSAQIQSLLDFSKLSTVFIMTTTQ